MSVTAVCTFISKNESCKKTKYNTLSALPMSSQNTFSPGWRRQPQDRTNECVMTKLPPMYRAVGFTPIQCCRTVCYRTTWKFINFLATRNFIRRTIPSGSWLWVCSSNRFTYHFNNCQRLSQEIESGVGTYLTRRLASNVFIYVVAE